MRGTKAAFAALVLTAIVGLAAMASAQGLEFLGVGSSAMFNTFAVAAFSDICSARTGSDCHHYSISGKNSADGQNFAQAKDSRNNSIPVEAGTLWIVWDNNTNPVSVWAYLSVDSVVGNRMFFANPRAQLQVDSGVLSGNPGQNKVPAAIMLNRQTNADQGDDSAVPQAVLTAVQATFTAALTDIRPEDAKFATNRILAAFAANTSGLGYNNGGAASCFQAPDSWTVSANLGCPIYGTWGAKATPVQFALTGKDPFSGNSAWKYTTIPVGAAPIVFVYNATDAAGLGALGSDGNVAFKNINHYNALEVFNGTLGRAQDLDPSLTQALQGQGGSPNPGVNVILREPLSGTMNTTEFNVFRTIGEQKEIASGASQEAGVDIRNSCTLGSNCPNPLALPGPGGSMRFRAIGTGAEISGVSGVGGVKNLADAIGYAFFSYGNVNPLAGPSGVGRYVTLDGSDPFNAGYGAYSFDGNSYAPGQLPLCTAPCTQAAGASFPNVRNGGYPAWSLLRLVTDASGANLSNAQALVAAAQNEVNNTVADFVPFVCTDTHGLCTGEPGLQVFRSHFTPTGVSGAPHNGVVKNEAGGDVGGAVFVRQADADYHADTNGELVKIRE
jgi:hypothetical protein